MKTLFITRKYPPAIGGMESFSYGLITNFPGEKIAITYGGSQKWLIFVYCYLFFKSLLACWRQNIDLIHLDDAVLAPMGWLFKKLTQKKVVITAHGKDVNFNFPFYQKVIIPFVKKIDRVVCVSEKTRQECLKRGVSNSKCLVIPDGFDFPNFSLTAFEAKQKIAEKYGLNLQDKFVILTAGRLSRRKGVYWFIKNVLALLPKNVVYLVVGGDATEINDFRSWLGIRKVRYLEKIQALVKEKGLDKRIIVAGEVSKDLLETCFKAADLFLMPNIKVTGDMEGFGIVAVEAAGRGLPTVAANLEGLKEAIKEGQNGYLVPWGRAEGFKEKIEQLICSPNLRKEIGEKAKRYTQEHYSWPTIAKQYDELFQKVQNG